MRIGFTVHWLSVCRCWPWFLAVMIALGLAIPVSGQSGSTGALAGIALDPTGKSVPGVSIGLTPSNLSETKTTESDWSGRFEIQAVPPGLYELQASKTGFEKLIVPNLNISVTETLRIELHLALASRNTQVQVFSDAASVQLDSSVVGSVVNEREVSTLPLVTRNFAQLVGLSPGVMVGVSNAGELGLGGTPLSQIAQSNDGVFAHGMRSYDNNWLLDGTSVSDVQASGTSSGGIPVPNPDAILEFKVQSGLYDAAYGRYGGANVSVITKSGGNDFHGTIFEFSRNKAFNANEYFRNHAAQPRAPLTDNQFGSTLGGPIQKEKLLFFSSYQGTRQVNGLASGQSRIACSASISEPPLTNDRSPEELGKLFGGMSGAFGNLTVKGDGSNINPAALALLNFKLPNGSFLIPTPQLIDVSKPLSSQGFSALSRSCHFSEDQAAINADFLRSENSKLAVRYFFSDDANTVTFPGNFFNPTSNIAGFDSPSTAAYKVFSLAHTHSLGRDWLNEMRIGYTRTTTTTNSTAPFKWSDLGVSAGEMNNNNEAPNLAILGSVQLASAFPRRFALSTMEFNDSLSTVKRSHAVRLGGAFNRVQDDFSANGFGSFVEFLSWPDFLLGLNAASNGSGTFSNVFASSDIFGLFNRQYRASEASAFVHDDYKASRSFTLNIGLRYERLGQLGDELGRNSSFDFNKADPDPPLGGSLDGYIVASNFQGTVPAGVTRVNNRFGNYARGQNTLAPRIGFAWQIFPRTNRFALRSGYGIYYSRPTGQAFFQNANGAPYTLLRNSIGSVNEDATFQAPFAEPFPTPASFPQFPPYSPSGSTTIFTVAPGFRPTHVQEFSLNVQSEPIKGWLLEIGYVGSRGTHLQRTRSLNQALKASPQDPIRGVTEDTVSNIQRRVPILGIPADSLDEVESEGSSSYDGLEASLTKAVNHGLQFLASYTFSKSLDTDGANINGTSSGTALTIGDQNSPRQRWGRTSFDRTHRFIFSATWTLPSPSGGAKQKTFGGWALAAIGTLQSGRALTIADTNANNVFGISEDRAQLTGSCTKSQLLATGSIESRLNGYFNIPCFSTPPVIGADGIGTSFGNSSTGIVDGPGQANLDIAISKTENLDWARERSSLEFRAEFFNLFNHPQFSNPDTNFSSSTFGLISSTAVNPRVGQLALRLSF